MSIGETNWSSSNISWPAPKTASTFRVINENQHRKTGTFFSNTKIKMLKRQTKKWEKKKRKERTLETVKRMCRRQESEKLVLVCFASKLFYLPVNEWKRKKKKNSIQQNGTQFERTKWGEEEGKEIDEPIEMLIYSPHSLNFPLSFREGVSLSLIN